MSYKTETGASDAEIMRTPWAKIVLRVLDKPYIDYDAKKEPEAAEHKTAADQMRALDAIFKQ